MFKKKILSLVLILATSNLFAYYENEDNNLGNIAINVGIWKTSLGGKIVNSTPTNVDFKNDLKYNDSKNITTFGLDLKNDISWLPNIALDYFKLNNSVASVLSSSKKIDGSDFSGSISTSTNYSELNTIVYGFLQQNIFEFDAGINIKKISYNQTIQENNGADIFTNDLNLVIPLVYVAFKLDLNSINTVLKAELSTLSIGDNEANSHSYSINYRMLQNMYISYGYRSNSWKSTNTNNIHEKYNVDLKGNYINIKILF